uniref:Uncharacterized protein n=1 Tax=Coccidioides posadasii RMSCC 3488 TaxID=454284 RepID=A0A0J6F8V5_COCPO|nr:hypothetical protein CPAG_02936 [Coccidioides posadasii RMSCC 3488]
MLCAPLCLCLCLCVCVCLPMTLVVIRRTENSSTLSEHQDMGVPCLLGMPLSPVQLPCRGSARDSRTAVVLGRIILRRPQYKPKSPVPGHLDDRRSQRRLEDQRCLTPQLTSRSMLGNSPSSTLSLLFESFLPTYPDLHLSSKSNNLVQGMERIYSPPPEFCSLRPAQLALFLRRPDHTIPTALCYFRQGAHARLAPGMRFLGSGKEGGCLPEVYVEYLTPIRSFLKYARCPSALWGLQNQPSERSGVIEFKGSQRRKRKHRGKLCYPSTLRAVWTGIGDVFGTRSARSIVFAIPPEPKDNQDYWHRSAGCSLVPSTDSHSLPRLPTVRGLTTRSAIMLAVNRPKTAVEAQKGARPFPSTPHLSTSARFCSSLRMPKVKQFGERRAVEVGVSRHSRYIFAQLGMELALRRDGDGFGGPNPHCSGAGRAQYAHRPDRSIVIVQQELRALRCGIRQIEGFDLIAFAIGQTMPVAYCLLLAAAGPMRFRLIHREAVIPLVNGCNIPHPDKSQSTARQGA